MRFVAIGDIYGRIGRRAFAREISEIRKKYNPDFLLVNVENASSGRGPILVHLQELSDLGIDVMTSGDHFLDSYREIGEYVSQNDSIFLRPANFEDSEFLKIPGKGYKIFEKNNKKILVINLIGTAFMRHNSYNPFKKIQEILDENTGKFDFVFLDFHREVTSEIYAMGMLFDGKINAIWGTHTHVQTNDLQVFPKGSLFISDLGFCGSRFSVIGSDLESLKNRFLTGLQIGKITQSLDPEYVVSGIFFEIDDNSKEIKNFEKIRIIGKL